MDFYEKQAIKDFDEMLSNKLTSAEQGLLAGRYFNLLQRISADYVDAHILHHLFATQHFRFALTALHNRIELYLQEIDSVQLLKTALLLMHDTDPNAISLGLIIAGHYEAHSHDLILRFCKKPLFSLYAFSTLQYFKNWNRLIWELLPELNGICSIIALYFFQPTTMKQQRYLLTDGQYNDSSPDLSAAFSLMNTELLDYTCFIGINSTNVSHFSHLFAYAFLALDAESFAVTAQLAYPYLHAIQKKSNLDFLDIAALCGFYRSMKPHQRGADMKNYGPQHYNDNVEKANGWSTDLEKLILDHVTPILQRPQTHQIITAALVDLQETPELLVWTAYAFDSAQYITSYLPFSYYLELLEHYPFYPLLLDIFSTHPLGKSDYIDIKYYLLENEDIWNTDEPSIWKAFAECWLLLLLSGAQKWNDYDEALFLSCLTLENSATRAEAVRALRKFKTRWSTAVLPILEGILEIETDPQNRRRLSRLIHTEIKPQTEETTDLTNHPITVLQIGGKHYAILHTYIAGIAYRKIDRAKSALQTGGILFLKREPDNPYDENAILIAAPNGCAVGYLPRTVNTEIAQAMDNGKNFYAVVTEADFDKKYFAIDICPSLHF